MRSQPRAWRGSVEARRALRGGHDVGFRARLARVAWIPAALALVACGGPTSGLGDVLRDAGHDGDGDAWVDGGGGDFDDHSHGPFETPEALLAYGDSEAPGPGQVKPVEPVKQVKFVLSGFSADPPGAGRFLQGSFYQLHDEWEWFRLLNGAAIAGYPVEPILGLSFPSVDAIREHFKGWANGSLPLELRWLPGRLYSPRFYDAALGHGDWAAGRFFGVGSVLHYPPDAERPLPGELWLFELEYVDSVTEAELGRFFEQVAALLPASVRGQLKWLARSSDPQRALASAVRAGGGPYADRVVTYDDLIVPGTVEGYNTGITAGPVRRVEAGAAGGASVDASDIVVLGALPDYLPPVAGIVTAVPQTPLAHLNLLAKARGTPNAFVAGVMDDMLLTDWSWARRPVILKVGPDAVTWKPFEEFDPERHVYVQYDAYRKRLGAGGFQVPKADLEGAPDTLDLGTPSLAEMHGLVPLIGGKCAGFIALHQVLGGQAEIPYEPLCVTVRPYAQHIAGLTPVITAMLAEDGFSGSKTGRFLTLEGEDAFRKEHAGDPAELARADSWLKDHPAGTTLGDLVAQGGLKRLLRDAPLDAAFEATLTATLSEHFAALGAAQGLRFRSSSTAEDAPGFNGAGLYDSNTGYLHPELQPTPKLQKRSVAWALKKTWASYWSYEAFEERRLAGISHLDGRMAVAVHPRFDDDLERANGVITFTLRHPPAGDDRELVVNVQLGPLSVTNPDPTSAALPEVDRVLASGDGPATVERGQPSTEVAPGEWLLSDEELLTLFGWIDQLSAAWLDQANEPLDAGQRALTLTLDLEFKRMAGAWPATAPGGAAIGPGAPRLVLKQARVLDHVAPVGEFLTAQPVPRDVMGFADYVRARSCESDDLALETVEVFTDPSRAQLVPFSEAPFTAYVALRFKRPVEGFDLDLQGYKPTWDQLAAWSHPGMGEGGGWSLSFTLPAWLSGLWGFESLDVRGDGSWSLKSGATSYEGAGLTCTDQELYVGASEFLDRILSGAIPP